MEHAEGVLQFGNAIRSFRTCSKDSFVKKYVFTIFFGGHFEKLKKMWRKISPSQAELEIRTAN